MSNILEDTMDFGLGLFMYSKEKIEEMVNKLVEKGQVAKQDASSFVAELTQKGAEQRVEIKKMIDDRVNEATESFRNVKPVTKEEVRAIIQEELAKRDGK